MLNVTLTGDDHRQAVFPAELVGGAADKVIAPLVRMAALVIREADHIKNQMIMNMILVDMGGKHKFVLADQYFFCKLHPDLMDPST